MRAKENTKEKTVFPRHLVSVKWNLLELLWVMETRGLGSERMEGRDEEPLVSGWLPSHSEHKTAAAL